VSAIIGFFKNHGLEAVALGDLVAKVRQGLAASHVAINDTPVRVHLLASIIAQALHMAQALCLQPADCTTRAALTTSLARDQVRLLHVNSSIDVLVR
jgi:hypothetical protein